MLVNFSPFTLELGEHIVESAKTLNLVSVTNKLGVVRAAKITAQITYSIINCNDLPPQLNCSG